MIITITCHSLLWDYIINFSLIRIYNIEFYDPDGYHFNKDRRDEFGGYYDSRWLYHPGEKNKHEFADTYDEDDDDLIRQYEEGDYDDHDGGHDDHYQEKLY